MPSKSLPERPSLVQLKLQAKELQQLHKDRRQSAAARIVANHPRFKARTIQDVLDAPFKIADAQLVIAREYGFESWARLKRHAETESRLSEFTPHPQFDAAVAAIDAGDLAGLERLLDAHPELVHARTNLEPPFGYFSGATLLHHVAWNPGRPAPVPANIVDLARLLLDRGAEVDATTLGRNGGTTLGLIDTSKKASDANVSGPLIQLLVDRGARIRLEETKDGGSPFGGSITNHAPRAAEKLIELGAKPDVFVAAALGRMDLLRGFFDENGRLTTIPRRNGSPMAERDAIGLALLVAYVNAQAEAVDFLLEHDGNWNMIGVNNGTALHRAAWDGDLAMVKRLVAKGADLSNRENPFSSTPLSWAQHNKQTEVTEWLRAHTAVDLHDAVGMNFREHVEARVGENPVSVNARVDQWDAPRSTPLYWAAWNRIYDIDGPQYWDEPSRLDLVRFLLDHGADPNIVAGDGHTALDVARTAGVKSIEALIRERGGVSSADL